MSHLGTIQDASFVVTVTVHSRRYFKVFVSESLGLDSYKNGLASNWRRSELTVAI